MSPKKILFVCTGNICRSAMAEHLLRHWSAAGGLDLEVRSAGTHADPSWKIPSNALDQLKIEGVVVERHKPTLLNREPLRWADVVFVMSREHRDHILELYPEFHGKTRLLRQAAGFGEEDVEDPMGRPPEAFARCLVVLKESLSALMGKKPA